MNLVYDRKPRRYAEDNRTEFNIVRTGKSKAEVTNNKILRSTIAYETLRGLSARTQLLVGRTGDFFVKFGALLSESTEAQLQFQRNLCNTLT